MITKLNLTAKEIVEIITACKGAVKSLEINDGLLKVEFTESHKPVEDTPSTQNQGLATDEIDSKEDFENNPTDASKESTERLLEELNITDPSAMEDLIVMREVENVADSE